MVKDVGSLTAWESVFPGAALNAMAGVAVPDAVAAAVLEAELNNWKVPAK